MKVSKNQLLEIIGKALEKEDVTMESSIHNTDEWDSLSQLSILTDLDNVFEGKVSEIDGIADAESISEIFDLLKNNSLIE
tara:strand:- start:379 stop:618 length:240 start_codon:yes stop_codon:yes gene_type:complete